jgi:lipopolysaccharide transport system ATP-binding protein
MSNLALSVDHLSKSFRITHQRNGLRGYRTLRDDLIGLPRRLLGRLRRNGQLTSETFWALKDVSFQVKKGEVVGIIGRNGAGKSTLLKILNRITEPTSGTADVYGRIGALLEVGTGFHPELTGRENVFLNGAILGMSRAEIRSKFDEIVAFAEIEKFLDTPVKHYSSGMYVRLAFAVAAHLNPEILLVDEVLAVGDADFQKKCLGKMEDVTANEGRTVIFVSHNIDAICHLCSRCILLRQGEIEQTGATADVVAAYLGATEHEPVVYFRPISGDASFESAGLYRPDGNPTTSYDANTPPLMKCSFIVRRAIAGLQVSLSVLNFKGEKLFYSSNSMADPVVSVEGPGTHHIAALIPARLLLPGRYFINLALHTPKIHLYDLREQALCFRIIGNPDPHHGFSSEQLGHVSADVQWHRIEGESTALPARKAAPILTDAGGS